MPANKTDKATLSLINERIEQVKNEITEDELRPLIRKIVREVLREELGSTQRDYVHSRQMEYKTGRGI